jgi:AcrR family transcriptional regulator
MAGEDEGGIMTAEPREILADGRRERSRFSHAKIVQALLDLVARGNISPSAAEVADAAGVGLRSVFRHFDDMDSLYQAMTQSIEAQIHPIRSAPLTADHWKGRVREFASRRMGIFESILPYRISANIKRYQSPFLMQIYRRMVKEERQVVVALLPAHLLADPVQTNALIAPLSFQTWRLLRHDEELPLDDAKAVVIRLIDAVLDQIADEG